MVTKGHKQAHGKASTCTHPTDHEQLRRLLDALTRDLLVINNGNTH